MSAILYSKHSKLLVLGAGGHAKVICDFIQSLHFYEAIELLDDHITGEILNQFQVIGTTEKMVEFVSTHDIFVAIGNNKVRECLLKKAEMYGFNIISLVHPSAVVSQFFEIGKGSVVMAGSIIQTNVYLGKGIIVNTAASIDHDSYISDFVHIAIAAHLAGNVRIGNNTWIGAGATIIQNVSVLQDCMIGAGAVLVKTTQAVGTYLGIPARLKE